jgi:hypothetical protein
MRQRRNLLDWIDSIDDAYLRRTMWGVLLFGLTGAISFVTLGIHLASEFYVMAFAS